MSKYNQDEDGTFGYDVSNKSVTKNPFFNELTEDQQSVGSPRITGMTNPLLPKEKLTDEMLKVTDSVIEKAHYEVSQEYAVRESVTTDYEYLKNIGRIADYNIESIDVSDPREPKVEVTMTLNKPIDNIEVDLAILSENDNVE